MNVGIIGGGVFGLAAAIELRERGHGVTVFDQGRVPYENATSTDVAKGIRRTWYGDGGPYVELVERAAEQWRAWERRTGESVYHRTGGMKIMRGFEPGSGMYANWRYLQSRGADLTIMTAKEGRARFPQFVIDDDEVCILDDWAGYIESERAVAMMAGIAREDGVVVREESPVTVIDESANGATVHVEGGGAFEFDRVVVAGGVWSGRLVPEVGRHLLVTLREMMLIEVENPDAFAHGRFPVWSDDPDTTGWYGFPLLREGLVKVSIEGIGEIVDPDIDRAGSQEFRDEAMEYLRWRIPDIGRGRVADVRACLYCATPDDHFIIDHAPGSERVVVATGGSGHGFKFGGSLGAVIADAVEDVQNPLGDWFRIGDRFKGLADQTRSVTESRGYALSQAEG